MLFSILMICAIPVIDSSTKFEEKIDPIWKGKDVEKSVIENSAREFVKPQRLKPALKSNNREKSTKKTVTFSGLPDNEEIRGDKDAIPYSGPFVSKDVQAANDKAFEEYMLQFKKPEITAEMKKQNELDEEEYNRVLWENIRYFGMLGI